MSATTLIKDIQELVQADGSWQEKRDRFLNSLSVEEHGQLEEFISWFTNEEVETGSGVDDLDEGEFDDESEDE